MSWNSRLDVVEALERAGWTGEPGWELSILRHPGGAVFGIAPGDGGECSIAGPGGVNCGEFSGDTPDVVVIAAALAASGQLVPELTWACDPEGPTGCPQAEASAGEYRYCGACGPKPGQEHDQAPVRAAEVIARRGR